MAKQRGIIQISGKINDHVYYEQKYVDTGLIRRQNAAMSSRVKNDPEFANTRRAGVEFGYCSQTAAAIIKQLPQRTSSIVFPFILPRFTRFLYKILRSQEGNVGYRKFPDNQQFVTAISQFLNGMSKNSWSGVFPPLNLLVKSSVIGAGNLLVFDRLAVQEYCFNNGFDGVRFTLYDEGEVLLGDHAGDGTYTRTSAYSFALRQRFTMYPDDTSDVTQSISYTLPEYGFCSLLVLAEPMRLVNNSPTYPKGVRAFLWGAAYKQ